MERQQLDFIRHMPEKIMFFSMTAYMLLCLTGTASAFNQVPIQNESGQPGIIASTDPGFILSPPAINIDPNFTMPWTGEDVDPDFSIPIESDKITVVQLPDESAVTSDTSPVQVPIDNAVLIPEP